ncbi:MAG: hypothetical protein ACYDCT_09710 [Dehalococcoidia bacterium]
MTAMDRFGSTEHPHSLRERTMNLALLSSLTTWFGLAAAGIIVVFLGLGVDAYRHNHSAAEESLLSFSNPGHVVAAIGLVLAGFSTLIGFSISAFHGIETRQAMLRRMAPVTAAWVLTAAVAVASITYLAASGATIGHSPGAGTTAATTAAHVHGAGTTAEAGGIVQGLQQNGLAPATATAAASSVPGALTQGADGSGHSAHDKGKQPTYTQIATLTDAQLLPLFPSGTMTLAEIPKLRQQLEAVRQVALKYPTPDAAKAGGYTRTTSDVPFMGEHWLNYEVIRSGIFDPSRPSGLLFSKIDSSGTEKLVGVWYLMVPGVGGVTASAPPSNTWAGNLALWHQHNGLCLVGLSSASEGETAASCKAKGGSFTPSLKWMMHVWVAPGQDNPDGVFAYLNNALYQQQVAAGNTGAPVQPNGTIAR